MQSNTRVGQTLGNYRLVKLLGRGGFAEVYLAENIHLGTQMAIKVLKPVDIDPLEQINFRSEAKMMTTLRHPHIIEVLDYGIEMSQRGSDGSTPYLVMEYAPLGTLRHLCPRYTPMPLPKIALYTKQIAEALQYAHDKDIIHRDIKPENMLVRRPDNVALSDFGIAVGGLNTTNVSEQRLELLQKMARAEPTAVSGTVPYLAPERLEGLTQRASDQYSLAVVTYEWLGGKRPFDGSNDVEICRKHIEEAPPPLHKVNLAIPQSVEQVVMKGLAKEPKNRYASVIEFSQALENAINASLPSPAPPNNLGGGYQGQQQIQQPTSTSMPQPSVNMQMLPEKPTEGDQEQPQHIPWWKQESHPFILADSAIESSDSLRVQQKKDGVTRVLFKHLREGVTKGIIQRKQHKDTLSKLHPPSLSKAPSTILFPMPVLPNEELKDFFISHSKADETWADWIAWELENAGYSTIVPTWDFRAGSDLKIQTQKAAAKARSSIIVLSPDYFNTSTSEPIRNILLGLDKVNEKHALLPILVRKGGSHIEPLLERIKCIDIVGLDEASARTKLLAEIRGERSRSTKRPVFPSHSSSNNATFLYKQSLETQVLNGEVSGMPIKSIEIFFSYSRQDEELQKELEAHLIPLKMQYHLKNWYDCHIDAGAQFAKEIDKHLQTADIILLLVTPNFFASNYCYKIEMAQALERHDGERVFVIPIILRPTWWKKTPLGHLQALPPDGIAVTSSSNHDAAFVEIVNGIEKVINKLYPSV